MSQNSPQPRLVSDFAGDPDMQELVGLFVSELPDRVAKLNATWNQSQLGEVQRLAHQLKGASAGYGFPTIGDAAGKLEDALRASDAANQSSLNSLKRDLDNLIDLCSRAAA
ncbi:MAG: Hpt domain-containing protein [Planctomycetes bacterium]|nr:Hpt domain-containing protein [Planctomycetota bacterium]